MIQLRDGRDGRPDRMRARGRRQAPILTRHRTPEHATHAAAPQASAAVVVIAIVFVVIMLVAVIVIRWVPRDRMVAPAVFIVAHSEDAVRHALLVHRDERTTDLMA